MKFIMDRMSEELPRSLPEPLLQNSLLQNVGYFKDMHDENAKPETLCSGIFANCMPKNDQIPAKNQLGPQVACLYPHRIAHCISDATLDITPEKLPKSLKKASSVTSDRCERKSPKSMHVRFDVPEIIFGSEKSLALEVSSPDLESPNRNGNQMSRILQEPFKKRAALYVQRNPLADITSDSYGDESSVSVTDRGNLNTRGITSLHDHRNTQTLPPVKLIASETSIIGVTKPPSQTVVKGEKGGIIVVKSGTKPEKSTMNQVTRPRQKTTEGVFAATVGKFLRKNSALHKREHTIRYLAAKPVEESPLNASTYNTTRALGQELQELKINNCNVKQVVTCKLQQSERLRTYIIEKAAEATNIDPKESLFQNLVSVDIPACDLIPKTSKWKKLKPKLPCLKACTTLEPSIWDFHNINEFQFAEPVYGDENSLLTPKQKCRLVNKVPLPSMGLAPLDAAEWLDCHEQLWKGAWGRHLPVLGANAFMES